MRNQLTLAIALVASMAMAQVDPQPRLGVVLDLERPSDTDVLLLRNGDQLTGTILNESFNIRTSYAELSFNNRVVAGIDLEGGANNIESIITVNDNRFSGFINDPVFVFRLQSGPVIEIRREKVLKAVFRLREQEREGIPQRQFVTMKNGDYFSGLLLNTDLVAATTYADVPLDLTSIESITFIGEANPLTRILFHNGDALQGILNQEDVSFVLDVGGEVEIYQDRIESVFLREGFVPGSAASTPDHSTDSRTDGTPMESAPGSGADIEIRLTGWIFREYEVHMGVLTVVDWSAQDFYPMVVAGDEAISGRDVDYDPELAVDYVVGSIGSHPVVPFYTTPDLMGDPHYSRLIEWLRASLSYAFDIRDGGAIERSELQAILLTQEAAGSNGIFFVRPVAP